MNKPTYNKGFIFAITLVSALGGLLFGYDWVVIGGAKPFYERFFEITSSPNLQGWAMSSALIGCLFGALFSGLLTQRFGRKIPLLLAAALFTISALGTGWVSSFTPFIIFRLIGGLGIGIASAVSPMYIAEVSPSESRGMLVSINQLTIVIGILLAQSINYLIAEPVAAEATDVIIQQSWNGQTGWRWMFWAETVPAALFFVLAFFIPESPRYLIQSGKKEQAKSILQRIGGESYALKEAANIAQTLKDSIEKSKRKSAAFTQPAAHPDSWNRAGRISAVVRHQCDIQLCRRNLCFGRLFGGGNAVQYYHHRCCQPDLYPRRYARGRQLGKTQTHAGWLIGAGYHLFFAGWKLSAGPQRHSRAGAGPAGHRHLCHDACAHYLGGPL